MNCSLTCLTRPIRTIVLGLAIMPLLSWGALNGQEQKLPKAEAILAKHLKAIGGKESLLKLKSRKMSGTLEIDIAGHQLKAKVEIQAQAPNKRHTVIESDALNMVRVTDGKNAWEWRGGHSHGDATKEELAESTKLLEGGEKKQTIEQAKFYDSVHWKKMFKAVKTKGLTKVNKKPAYEVAVTTQSGETYSQFYDKESGRLVKVARKIENAQMGKIDIEVFLKDYKKFDNVWIATKVEQMMEIPNFGKGSQIWTYTTIKHNVKIADSLFKLPKHLEKDTSQQK